MSADEFYGMKSLGRQDGHPLRVEIYIPPELLRVEDPERVKHELGEQAWTQAHGLEAARTEEN
jgi:hypothetical protein